MILLFSITILLIIPAFIALYNFLTAPRIKPKTSDDQRVLVSILIPARNEEKNIPECLSRIQTQSYKNFEVVVLDDNSDDNTLSMAEGFKERIKKLKVLKGKGLPKDWLGKNWACSQLSEHASGELFLFIDADVLLEPKALESAVYYLNEHNTDLLTLFPTQIMKSLGEHLAVPMMNWLLLSFLPLKKVYYSKNISLVAANGQFMLWERESYFKAGGHVKYRNEVVEDMEMARSIKKSGGKVLTMLGDDLIKCRMYESISEAVKGFSKNFFPGFKIGAIKFALFITSLFFLFFMPIFFAVFSVEYLLPVIIIILNRIFVSFTAKQNAALDVMLHPLQMLAFLLIGINSIISTKKKTSEWKGRKI